MCIIFLLEEQKMFSFKKKFNIPRGLKEKHFVYLHNCLPFHNLFLLFASVKFVLFVCTLPESFLCFYKKKVYKCFEDKKLHQIDLFKSSNSISINNKMTDSLETRRLNSLSTFKFFCLRYDV
jgi:hypothetical protein